MVVPLDVTPAWVSEEHEQDPWISEGGTAVGALGGVDEILFFAETLRGRWL